MSAILTSTYVGFGATFIGALALHSVRGVVSYVRNYNKIKVEKRASQFEEFLINCNYYSIYAEKFIKEPNDILKQKLISHYLSIKKNPLLEDNSEKVKRYKKRIESIVESVEMLYLNLDRSRLSSGKNKVLLQNLKDRLWSITDKLKAENGLFS